MDQKTVTILIGVIVITIVAYLYYRQPEVNKAEEKPAETFEGDESFGEEAFEEGMAPIEDPNDQKPDDIGLANKFVGKNSAVPPEQKRFNYVDGKRGNVDMNEWDTYFAKTNEPVSLNYIQNNDRFVPSDSSATSYAVYTGANQKSTNPQDMFKSDELLPQEMNKDWFEVMPDQIKVKNRHLINVTKPIGVNTIGSSLKNPSYDIRGTPSCPKFVVSPWMQSSIEPDINIKGLC